MVDEEDVMLKYARSLSFEQRIVFDKIMKLCKAVLRSNNGADIIPNPPKLIVTGCGGTGKSHLIMVVSKWVEKMFINPGPVNPKVLLLAFTGVASSLIGD